MEKRTKIVIILVLLVVIGIVIASSLALKSGEKSIELEVLWPNSDSSKQPLIQLHNNDPSTWLDRKQSYDNFFNEYRVPTPGEERVSCSYNRTVFNLTGNEVCDVPVDSFYVCNGNVLCVMLSLNKLPNWSPAPYNNSLEGFPQNMPGELQNTIEAVERTPEANTVWVTCEGENPADEEYMGELQFIPRRGFPSFYYPYTNQKKYLRPIVAVMFLRPELNVVINVQCTAWAKNIRNDEEVQQGVVHFSIMID